ncbi:hypothetical protein J1N35_020508 [Gossypium stocksii]|uniref:STML2-like C-terminal extension domain-containing protein n=1 Tax=Gossypium stocksii TaxID=47602 RepID=A0A9D3VDX2_9ROSI|nr:hypothetical protein J1N35_020508 [Gossypium stocksii]
MAKAEAILANARATAKAIREVAAAIGSSWVKEATVRVVEQNIEAFSVLAKESSTTLLPNDVANPAGMMAQALGLYRGMIKRNSGK